KYLRRFPQEIVRLAPETSYSVNGLTFTTSGRHVHQVETYGFRFGHRLGWITDSAYYEGIAEQHQADVMLIHTILMHCRPDLPHPRHPRYPRHPALPRPGLGRPARGPIRAAGHRPRRTGLDSVRPRLPGGRPIPGDPHPSFGGAAPEGRDRNAAGLRRRAHRADASQRPARRDRGPWCGGRHRATVAAVSRRPRARPDLDEASADAAARGRREPGEALAG